MPTTKRIGACGARSITGTAHGCGSGLTVAAAVAAAEAEASAIARAAADTWIVTQRCPATCPLKRNPRINVGGSGAKAKKTISTNLIGGSGSHDGKIPPVTIFRICIAIRWTASVTCAGPSDNVR